MQYDSRGDRMKVRVARLGVRHDQEAPRSRDRVSHVMMLTYNPQIKIYSLHYGTCKTILSSELYRMQGNNRVQYQLVFSQSPTCGVTGASPINVCEHLTSSQRLQVRGSENGQLSARPSSIEIDRMCSELRKTYLVGLGASSAGKKRTDPQCSAFVPGLWVIGCLFRRDSRVTATCRYRTRSSILCMGNAVLRDL